MTGQSPLEYDGTLEALFDILDKVYRGELPLPAHIIRAPFFPRAPFPLQGELFPDTGHAAPAALPSAVTAPSGPAAAELLRELSINAYDDFVHAWMSELPVEAEIIRFGLKVLRSAGAPHERAEAERAAADRGDTAVQVVSEAAYKTTREIHRLMGLLRFRAGADGVYTARCAPDHFILPALADHFLRRFGETPWIIIDEKRRLCLTRLPGEEPRLAPADSEREPSGGTADFWEDYWRIYHRSVNNESRENPRLQRAFMPRRYWKYLSEFSESGPEQ
jgi:probable DNA metabolism protein